MKENIHYSLSLLKTFYLQDNFGKTYDYILILLISNEKKMNMKPREERRFE